MLLLDASVWVAALDRDGRFHFASRELATSSDPPLAALDLTLYEVAYAVNRRLGGPEAARAAVSAVQLACGDRIQAVDADMIGEAAKLAVEHRLTVYDAAYVAVARRQGWTFVSADIADLVSSGLAFAPDALPE